MIEEKDKDFSIYEVPLSLVNHGLDELIVNRLKLRARPLQMDDWHELLHRLRNPRHEISIAVVGKYAEHRDAYKSIYESLDHAGVHHAAQVRVGRIHSEEIEREGPERLLSGYHGVLVPGGFGERGIEGKVEAIRFARERGIPFLGICLGMQCAVIEFARNVVQLAGCPLVGIPQGHAASGDLPAGRPAERHRQGRDHAAGGPAGPAGARQQGSRLLRHRVHLRTSPPPLRVQQRLSSAVRGPRDAVRRHQSGRRLGRDYRTDRPPLVCGRAVSPGVQVAADRCPPPVRGFHRRRHSTSRDALRTSSRSQSVLRPRRQPFAAGPVPSLEYDVMSENAGEKPKIIVDEDWKSQVDEERSRLKQQADTPSPESTDAELPPLPPASFAWLVTTLATQAMVSLGQILDPLQQKPIVNLPLAKHYIDMLAMLEQKTRGNLDREEAELLETVQHQLRMAYVAMQNQPLAGQGHAAQDAP